MEDELLNKVGQLLLNEVKKTFSEFYPSRAYNGQQKPINAQFPPIFSPKIATGTYVNSLTYSVETDPESNQPFIKIFSTLPEGEDYGFYIQNGRPSFSEKGPRIAEIRRWMSAKNIQPQPLQYYDNTRKKQITRTPSLRQLEFLIIRSIRELGIYPVDFVQITYDRVRREIIKQMEPAAAEYVSRLIREKVVFMVNPRRQTR